MTLAYFEARGLLLTVLESRTWVVELKETQQQLLDDQATECTRKRLSKDKDRIVT